jgi:hypothetical protein
MPTDTHAAAAAPASRARWWTKPAPRALGEQVAAALLPRAPGATCPRGGLRPAGPMRVIVTRPAAQARLGAALQALGSTRWRCR